MSRNSRALTTVLFMLLGLCARTADSRDADDKAKVVDAMEQMYVALTHDDRVKFKQHTTADFFSFDGGVRFTAESLVQLIKDAHAGGKIYVWKVTEPVVELHGDTALITYTNVGTTTNAAGEKKSVSWLESATLRKDQGVWRVSFFHSTRVPAGVAAAGQPLPPEYVDDFAGKPRVLVLTDVGNEPDDQMSLVRLLLYSNELELEGLVATTSTWQKEKIQPETLREVIAAYGEVRANLLLHAAGWPEAQVLDALVTAGQPAYGMAAVGADQMTRGAEAIIAAVDRPDPRPLFITVWGGANTLAQALMHVRATRSSAQVDEFVRRIRVRAISDQDDAGPWIRREFPALSYVGKPSNPESNDYGAATWTGISGDVYYRNCAGADFSLVTNEWLDANIRAKGPLGKHYPRFAFIMEGDTPSFLGLTNNGLESFRNPSWGGWGGRYVYLQPYGETHAMWSQGGDLFNRVTSQDVVTGVDGKNYVSDQATIWRWREACQNEFAARMDWTVKPFAGANHAPQLKVNGQAGTAVLRLAAKVGEDLALDASASSDPDGNPLKFRWFQYDEAGFVPGQNLGDIEIARPASAKTRVKVTRMCRPDWLNTRRPCNSGTVHVILAVTDNGTPKLTSYRRVIIDVRQLLSFGRNHRGLDFPRLHRAEE